MRFENNSDILHLFKYVYNLPGVNDQTFFFLFTLDQLFSVLHPDSLIVIYLFLDKLQIKKQSITIQKCKH